MGCEPKLVLYLCPGSYAVGAWDEDESNFIEARVDATGVRDRDDEVRAGLSGAAGRPRRGG